MKWILLFLMLVSCAPMLTTVDYDDLYFTKHYDYQGNFNWYQYRRSYVAPPAYYNYYTNPWFYPHERIVVQKLYVLPDQQRQLTPGKRPDRESGHRIPSHSNRGSRRD